MTIVNEFNVAHIDGSVENDLQYWTSEFDKLCARRIKACLLVNRSHSLRVKIDEPGLEFMAGLVKARLNTVILTDDVYCA
ncbi:hypothetical protein [Paraburkholderia adhaesiva]|uniref:hypothetical protein n=1 Tax=Paraburkholderia adhaesiva TaxID=2883244 RepID=UPI001F20917D|nr:hypothetical protein [Paraburkholderia adhaesiva]